MYVTVHVNTLGNLGVIRKVRGHKEASLPYNAHIHVQLPRASDFETCEAVVQVSTKCSIGDLLLPRDLCPNLVLGPFLCPTWFCGHLKWCGVVQGVMMKGFWICTAF